MPNPLARWMVAPGHFFDESTGLVKPFTKPQTTEPPTRRGKK